MEARPKNSQILETVRAAVVNRHISLTEHAQLRLLEREITAAEMRYVLLHGHHEAKKDKYNEEFKDWDYAIRGKTAEARKLRIVVAIESPGIIVVTAIDLEREYK